MATLLLALLLGLLEAPAGAATRPMEESLHRMVNQARGSTGLQELTLAGQPTRKARRHSARMAAEGRIFHTTCLQCDFGRSRRIAENVGMGGSLNQVMQAMMGSPPHQHNILGSYDQVGLGVVRRGGVLWVTMVFLQ